MKTKHVSSYPELLATITELKADKEKHEALLKQNMNDVKEGLKPANLLKSALNNIVRDRSLHTEALKTGLVIGAEYLIERLFKNHKSKEV